MSKRNQRLFNRSGNGCCAICNGMGERLVLHHTQGRDIVNANDDAHTCWLCSSCHDACHVSPPDIVIEGWYMTSNGRMLIWHRQGEGSITGGLCRAPSY